MVDVKNENIRHLTLNRTVPDLSVSLNFEGKKPGIY